MTQQEVMDKVLAILEPFSSTSVSDAKMETSILKDLKVNSARLVDVVLEIEETFDMEVSDEEADSVRTVGDAVQLILNKK